MYCRHCLYDLRSSDRACPECGEAFDPADPRTFKATTRRLPQPEGVVSFVCMILMLAYLMINGSDPQGPLARQLGLPSCVDIDGWLPGLGLLGATLLFGYSSMKREAGVSSQLAAFACGIASFIAIMIIIGGLMS